MFPIIISYYTKNTGYEDYAKTLIASCERWNLCHSITGIANLGSWERNCCYKPKYIMQKLFKLKSPLLWVDADAEIIKKPMLFQDFSPDIALCIIENVPDDHPSKMISGTIYFNYTPIAFNILEAWDHECERLLKKHSDVWDQVALRNVLLQHKDKATIYPLPLDYYRIYDRQKKGEQSFIIHYQASRIEKKVINNELIPFWRNQERDIQIP